LKLQKIFTSGYFVEAKEQFSDGVGYEWIDQLKAYCNTQVTDEQLAGASVEFPIILQPQRKLTCIVLYFINITRKLMLLKQLENGFQDGRKMKIRVEGLAAHIGATTGSMN
jgi:hypothetical protein